MLSEMVNGTFSRTNGLSAPSESPPMGFTAVNTRQSAPAERVSDTPTKSSAKIVDPLFSQANTDSVTVLNGASIKGISQEQRVELIKSFLVNADIQARDDDLNRRSSLSITRSATQQNPPQSRSESIDPRQAFAPSTTSAVPIPSTPAALLPYLKPTALERDDGGPYKVEMVNRMESLHRGERIIPPCDRCRRLHMDCLKNLTACMGCTKKHAKCSWKDVREEELRTNRPNMRTASYSPEHVGPSDEHADEHADLATPDASPSSHHSTPASAVQPVAIQEPPPPPPPPVSTSRRELDLLPPPSSLTTALTTSTASPSIYSSVERRSEGLPPKPQTPIAAISSSSAPRIPTPPNHSTTSINTTTTISNPTAAASAVTISQQLQDAANGLAAAHRSVFPPLPPPPPLKQNSNQIYIQNHNLERLQERLNYHANEEDEEEDEGDRLQALAAQVYRSASSQQHRS